MASFRLVQFSLYWRGVRSPFGVSSLAPAGIVLVRRVISVDGLDEDFELEVFYFAHLLGFLWDVHEDALHGGDSVKRNYAERPAEVGGVGDTFREIKKMAFCYLAPS